MDSKTIRNNLKQAKEALKNKEISSALNICKAVLKEDRTNYIALVLLGAAFQESDQKDQAPNAFRKAIEVAPDQILAWQGLAAFYEKDDVNKQAEQLASVYQRLLSLESDSSKWCEIVSKLESVITKFSCDELMTKIVSEHKSVTDNVQKEALCKLVVHYLSQVDIILPEESSKLYEEVLNSSLSVLQSEHCQIQLKLFYNQHRTIQLLEFCEKLIENGCQDTSVLEWMFKVCAEEYVENRDRVIDWCTKLPKYFSNFHESGKDNVLAWLAEGVYHMSRQAFLEARQSLERCLSLNGGLYHAVCLLAETHLRMLCLKDARSQARGACHLRPTEVAPKAILAKSMALSEDPADWETAATLAKDALSEYDNQLMTEALCIAYLKMGQWSELISAITRLTHAPTLAAFLRLEADAATSGKDLLMNLAQHTPDCPEAWYRLGELYLKEESYDLACTAFLKCAKLAPYLYTVYHQLGSLYVRTPSTLDKARRCFQQALRLHPNHFPTQRALSDTYRALGDSKNNLALLLTVCQSPDGRWAWPRLGLQYSDLGDTSAAINCLRAALKTAPNDSHMWEALADTYLARGANGSALKSYQKVLELQPGSFYSALQIATIKQITDLPEESLIEFRELVTLQPSSTLALKGLGETCIVLAKGFLSRRLLGLTRDRLQEGLTAVSSAAALRPDLACIWKLAGDCLTMAGNLPAVWSYLQVSSDLNPKVGEQTLRGRELLELGARCFCRCIKLMPDEGKIRALVWHDLSLNYYQQSRLASDSSDGCQKALAAAKQSVTLNPRNWQHWNQLGVVAALPEIKLYSLAQHAFIRATMADDSVAMPWSNLGFLYLCLHELKLANASFSAAQGRDSEFCPSWVGQAIIAQKVDNFETMDLFYHTTQLSYQSQSCFGYARWVCQTLHKDLHKTDLYFKYSIENLHAVPTAIDCLTWATDEVESACGLNMLGCLLERSGLVQSSIGVLSRAVDSCPPAHRDKVLANFARVLLKAHKVDDAIQVYKAVSKADIHTQCGLALALYKGKLYQEAYEAYEAALNWWAADDGVKSHLHVALAAVGYKLAGAEKAKALLLQGNQLKPPSVHGLFATCSLGMLTNDLEISKLVLKELISYENKSEYASDVALFQAYTKFIEGESQCSVWSMSKAVKNIPSLAALWLHLALLILNKQSLIADPPHKVAVAAKCAETAMMLGRTNMDVSKVLAIVSLSHLMSGTVSKALSASQHAVHLYPATGESWAVLAASCHAAGIHAASLRSLISHARQHTELERPLAKWMSHFERKIALLAS